VGALEDGSVVRVALPMVNFVPGGMGGTETYARELVAALAERADVELDLFVPRPASGAFSTGLETVLPLAGQGSTTARLGSVLRGLTDPRVRRTVRASRPDVVHFPFTVPVPWGLGVPRVLTVHDLQHHDLPEFFGRTETAFRSLAYDRAARRAGLVVTVSQFAKDRIVKLLGVDPSRVVVAPLGVSSQFVPYDGPRQDFVLYPARRWPHKNHERLVAAVTLVRQTVPGLRLVLTGGGAPLADVPSWVEQPGLVDQAELADLYRAAACTAFPSLYEGFGMPPLEAMASGCPVAVSSAGALPEVVGDAGIQFDPTDVGDMASAIRRALESRERLAPLGVKRATRFTWEACAEAHMVAYRRLAARTP